MPRTRIFALMLFSNVSFGWTQAGVIAMRGHEEITRQALQISSSRFSAPAANEPGSVSSNPVIQGNFGMDFPDSVYDDWVSAHESELRDFFVRPGVEMVPEALAFAEGQVKEALALANLRFNVTDYMGADHAANWHNSIRLQPVHFLRPFIVTEAGILFESISYVQTESESLIRNLANATSEFFNSDASFPELSSYYDRLTGYLLGAALHVIQDSYSPAHVKRVGPGLEQIADVCIYGVTQQQAGTQTLPCIHKETDENDLIWNVPVGQIPFGANTDYSSYMKPEAVAAVLASVRFLNLMEEVLQKRDSLASEKPHKPNLEGMTSEQMQAATTAYYQALNAWITTSTLALKQSLESALSSFFGGGAGT